jgi:methylenetetrahydrofolate dehydrogenase (NADP+) / methenyltetrahydrofolate cyclohydrolase
MTVEKTHLPGARLLYGSPLVEDVLIKSHNKIISGKIRAKLAVILVGNDLSSKIYVEKKMQVCRQVGIDVDLLRFNNLANQNEVENLIILLNSDPSITGILVQLPLPRNLKPSAIINKVDLKKDVDGLTTARRNMLSAGIEQLACCTPKGIIRLLENYKIKLQNKTIGLVGFGFLVGQPLAAMLKNRNLKFFVCDKSTACLEKETKKADLLVSATGAAHLIKKTHLKSGAIVVDAGISKLNGKVVGDVDFQDCEKAASAITPVPGGVGPITIAMLIENVLEAYEIQKS